MQLVIATRISSNHAIETNIECVAEMGLTVDVIKTNMISLALFQAEELTSSYNADLSS